MYAEVPVYHTWAHNRCNRCMQGACFESGKKHDLYSEVGPSGGCTLCTLIRRNTSCRIYCCTLSGLWRHNREACTKRGLLEEATVSRAASKLHQLFSIMLTAGDLDELLKLWATHKTSMAEDILARIKGQTSVEIASFNNAIYNEELLDLDTILKAMGGNWASPLALTRPEVSPWMWWVWI